MLFFVYLHEKGEGCIHGRAVANKAVKQNKKKRLKTTNATIRTCIETQMLKAVEVRFPPIPRQENRS